MKRSFISAAVAGILLSLLPSAMLRADSAYHVGAEDVLQVRVARHDELSGEVTVLQDGRVTLPLVGDLRVAGLTIDQIQDQVVRALRKRLVNPDVTVEISHPRPQRVFISGAVKTSQWLDLKEGWRVTEALASAGGLTVLPEVARGTIFRQPGLTLPLDLARIYVNQDPTANVQLQPGDVIDIEEPPTVRIVVGGQVVKPGMMDLTRGQGVREALAQAGGALSSAALSQAYVVKHDGRKLPVNLERLINDGGYRQPPAAGSGISGKPDGSSATAGRQPPAAGSPSADVDLPLEAGDELVVPENLTKIVVWGMVNHPQVYPLPDGQVTTLADAIALAGGFDKRARKSQIGILRMVNGKETVIKADMNRFVKGSEVNPPLQDRDIIYVPETRAPDWAGKILPSLQALAGTWFYVR